MKKTCSLIAGGFIAGLFVTAFFKYLPSNSGEWASWVQALGSIAAIVAAAVIASGQSREAQKRERSAELRTVEAASALSVQALAIVQDVLGHRTGVFTINNFHPAMQRAVNEIRRTLERLPVERMLQDGVLHSVFMIRTQLVHLSALLESLPLPPFNVVQRDHLKSIEQTIRAESERLKGLLAELF